jgi:hypothetical protein
LIVTVAASGLLLSGNASLASAQSPPHGSISLRLRVNEHSLSGRPAMVSAIRDGNIIEQEEVPLSEGRELGSDNMRPGVYDVRVEGEGIVTEIKRGIHVFNGQRTEIVFDVRPGKGVHIVEYATGGLSREEVAARLAKLEAEVAELSKTHTQRQH